MYRTTFTSNVHIDPASVFNQLLAGTKVEGNYPPFNHLKIDEETHRLEIAVSGFTREELSVSTKNGILTVKGEKTKTEDESEYLVRGISGRKFIREWKLSPQTRIEMVELHEGILSIDVCSELPESLKTKEYEINSDQHSGTSELLQE